MKPTHCERCGCSITQPKTGKRRRCVECSIIVAREKNAIDVERSRVKRILREQISSLLST
jgi:RNase P protein component